MNEFKYQFINILLLSILGFGIYWAFIHIDNKIIYNRDDVVENTTENNIVSNHENNKEEIIPFENVKFSEEIKEETKEEEKLTKEETQESVQKNKNKVLIGSLSSLKDKKIILSIGSSGDGVGLVQEFLNIYNNNKTKIDKDYGPTTKRLVVEFQKKELNGGDGRVGPNTIGAMIQWLEKQD